jgi:hypothetical protein
LTSIGVCSALLCCVPACIRSRTATVIHWHPSHLTAGTGQPAINVRMHGHSRETETTMPTRPGAQLLQCIHVATSLHSPPAFVLPAAAATAMMPLAAAAVLVCAAAATGATGATAPPVRPASLLAVRSPPAATAHAVSVVSLAAPRPAPPLVMSLAAPAPAPAAALAAV